MYRKNEKKKKNTQSKNIISKSYIIYSRSDYIEEDII